MLSRLGGRGYSVKEDSAPYAFADFDPKSDPDSDPDSDSDSDDEGDPLPPFLLLEKDLVRLVRQLQIANRLGRIRDLH